MIEIERQFAVEEPQFLRAMTAVTGAPFLAGNQVDTLNNGDEIFPAMLAAIRGAQHSVTLETYIYWSGEIGDQFTAALAERAGAGVAVHVLVDWAGSQALRQEDIRRLTDAGVEFCAFHPLRWYQLGRLNNRTHRKLLVVDGLVGFTGGAGIADEWLGNAQDPAHWRDTHYRVTGPVVAQMQSAFLENWSEATGKLLHGDRYLPEIGDCGAVQAQLINSAAGAGFEAAYTMVLLALAAASRFIHLSMAYFIPDAATDQLLVQALERGVEVKVIVPGRHMDVPLVRAASRACWGSLLGAGGEIYEYQPTMFHNKVLVVDGLWSSVGSTNFDDRSFKLNDEANLNVYDRGFAQRQIENFERDRERSLAVTYDQWRRRPRKERLRERLASLLRSQL